MAEPAPGRRPLLATRGRPHGDRGPGAQRPSFGHQWEYLAPCLSSPFGKPRASVSMPITKINGAGLSRSHVTRRGCSSERTLVAAITCAVQAAGSPRLFWPEATQPGTAPTLLGCREQERHLPLLAREASSPACRALPAGPASICSHARRRTLASSGSPEQTAVAGAQTGHARSLAPSRPNRLRAPRCDDPGTPSCSPWQ